MNPITCLVTATVAVALLVGCANDPSEQPLESLDSSLLGGEGMRQGVLLGGEIMRHVVDECDFYLQHQGNRIDFDPLEAEEMRIQIHLSRRVERTALRDRIHEVVRSQSSFYKRSLMYNAYYRLCIQQIGADEAERVVLQGMSTPDVPNSDFDNVKRTHQTGL